MEQYANKNTLDYIEVLQSEKAPLDKKEIYKRFWENFATEIFDDAENYKEVYRLIDTYKKNQEYRDGIDLTFIALTGYSLGTLLEQSIQSYNDNLEE